METLESSFQSLIGALSRLESVRAIGKTGGAALPADGFSDIDLFIFCEQLPTRKERAAVYASIASGCSVVKYGETEHLPDKTEATEFACVMFPMPNDDSASSRAYSFAVFFMPRPLPMYVMAPPIHSPFMFFLRYIIPSVLSAQLVIIPKKAEKHIQNTAPGPPALIAVATPTILPVPMQAARAAFNAWYCEIDFLPLLLRSSLSRRAENSVSYSHFFMWRT